MQKAEIEREFREAISTYGLVYHNIMYADTAGNIFYIYNGGVPRRDHRRSRNAG